MKEEEIRRGIPPFNGHLLIKRGGSLIIYRECEFTTGKHSFTFKDTPFNEARANILLFKLNNNKRPAQIIYNRLKEIKATDDPVLNHELFDQLKKG